VPNENNIAMKNVTIVNPSPGAVTDTVFLAQNPFGEEAVVMLVFDRSHLPKNAIVEVALPHRREITSLVRGIREAEYQIDRERQVHLTIRTAEFKLDKLLLKGKERIPIKIKITMPDRVYLPVLRREYYLDVKQFVNRRITGGLRFVVPFTFGRGLLDIDRIIIDERHRIPR
jgi:hypothetical protein